jgi:hypothetical protein
VNSFIGAGSMAANTLGSLAAQNRAAAMQQQQFEAQQLQQDQAAAQSHHCQPGYSGALLVHADGTRELICEQRR